ncbi:MAG: hypothetical protein JNL34_15615, partial [Anaerolineae bacterium]|nr:hypothetical protein [Anaerolineae bacterium]
ELRMLRADEGRQRFRQVVGVEKHRVIALTDGENGGLFIHELMCEDDYPHNVTAYHVARIADSSGSA